jgi:putative phage-type endonuclease
MLTQQEILDRVNFIGASDVACIFNLSQYKTPYALYLEKLGVTPLSFEQTEYQRWGSLLEPVIREEFKRRHPDKVITTPKQLTHPKLTFFKGNLDGYLPDENAILEIKTCSAFNAKQWGEQGSDCIPLDYMLQVATYCAIAQADKAYIVVLIGGNDYREYSYQRDLDIERRILEECTKFWQCVQQQNPPELVNINDIKLKYPTAEPEKFVVLPDALCREYDNLLKIKAQLYELTRQEESLKIKLMSAMQDSELLVNANGETLASYKNTKRGRSFLIK